MTDPGDTGSFDYTDDSVIAKIAVEVPAGAVSSLAEIAQQTHQLRTEMEALARAQGNWLGYLESLPEIAQQAAQAQQNLITQLERTAYIQNELGGMGGNVGMTTGEPGGPAGGAQAPQQGFPGYNTSAPPGYMNPFMGMTAGMGLGGMGMGMGGGMGMGQASAYMQNLATNDPRMYANMLAQRGMPVDPGMLHQMGGGGGGGGGGSAGGGPRASQQPPAANQGGVPQGSAPQPGQGGGGGGGQPPSGQSITDALTAPSWQQRISSVGQIAQQISNETQQAGMGGQGALGRTAGAARVLSAAGPALSAGGAALGGGAMGSVMSGMGMAAKVAGPVGLALTAGLGVNSIVQNAGEQWLKYNQIGTEVGEGGMEGIKQEGASLWEAFTDPQLNTEQMREIKQRTMSGGFSGTSGNKVEDAMQKNMKQYGMGFEETMNLIGTSVTSTSASTEEFNKNLGDMDAMLKRLKETTKQTVKEGGVGASYSTLKEQAGVIGAAVAPMGVDVGDVGKITTDLAEQMKGVPALSANADMAASFAGMMANPAGAIGIGQMAGLVGVLPEEVPFELGQEMGNATWNYAKMIAGQIRASGMPDGQGAMTLRAQLNAMGASFTPAQARPLYYLLTDRKPPDQESGSGVKPIAINPAGPAPKGGTGERAFTPPAGYSDLAPSGAEGFREESAAMAMPGYGGAMPSGDPTLYAPAASSSTTGTVTGTLNISVNPTTGAVSAPQQIQLTGVQVNANNGGGANKNEPGPGQHHG